MRVSLSLCTLFASISVVQASSREPFNPRRILGSIIDGDPDAVEIHKWLIECGESTNPDACALGLTEWIQGFSSSTVREIAALQIAVEAERGIAKLDPQDTNDIREKGNFDATKVYEQFVRCSENTDSDTCALEVAGQAEGLDSAWMRRIMAVGTAANVLLESGVLASQDAATTQDVTDLEEYEIIHPNHKNEWPYQCEDGNWCQYKNENGWDDGIVNWYGEFWHLVPKGQNGHGYYECDGRWCVAQKDWLYRPHRWDGNQWRSRDEWYDNAPRDARLNHKDLHTKGEYLHDGNVQNQTYWQSRVRVDETHS